MGISQSEIADLVLETFDKLVKAGAFVDMQTDLTDHVAVREMWKGRQKTFDGGLDWRFEVQMDHNHSARFVGLYETDTSAFADTMTKGTVPVRHMNAHHVWDLREPAFQQGGTKIVDFLKTKVQAMHVSVFEKLEPALWEKPVDSNDLRTPFGIKYWVTRGATEGLTGGNPAGFAAGKAGISQATFARWANWSAPYVAVSKVDLLRKMRKAARKTAFRSPLSHATPDLGSAANGIYTNDAVITLLEEVVEDQNMNLGDDMDSKGGRSLFKGTPITYVPYLDTDTSSPVYMLDWKWLAIGVMAGWENNVTPPRLLSDMHNVQRVDLDASLNMICTDLRRQAVLFVA